MAADRSSDPGAIFEPAIECAEPGAHFAADEARWRRQVAYLFARSAFYKAKFAAAGLRSPDDVGGLADLARLPLTLKDELRASQQEHPPVGAHCAAPFDDIKRVFSTSGTTGTPSYIPLTAADRERWLRTSRRAYTAAGIRPHHRVLTTYNAGPFVAGLVLDTLQSLGCGLIPVGTGNTDRLITALGRLRPHVSMGTPSALFYIAEAARARGVDPAQCGLAALVTGGEPGGSEPAMRQRIEQAFRAPLCEVLGVGDVGITLWAEGPEQDGMHFCAYGTVHAELIDPATEQVVPFETGATGEVVYTHLHHEAAPLVRFRSRDHVVVTGTGRVASGRTGTRIRCIGRTDDMLIVRGVNLFPSAVREVVARFAPAVTGTILIRPSAKGVRQEPPLPLQIEIPAGATPALGLAATIEKTIRDVLVVTTRVEFVPPGTIPGSEYKTRLVDFSSAAG
ncbi:MAG: phenylacetate--CoA ligase [Alphaproteobacteria bacterium]|nr:phenylacetate--CoA ligase [Alphaproteobacteria bacterium]